MGKLLDSSICLFSYQKTNLKRINDTSRVSAKKAIKKIGGAQKKIDIASSQHYATREILWYDKMNVECPYFDKGNLTKHKKTERLVLLEQLLDTLEYQFVTAGTSVIVDFMSLKNIQKLGMFLRVHEKLFLLQVILIGSRLFAIPILKFQSKNWLEFEEQKRNPLKLST